MSKRKTTINRDAERILDVVNDTTMPYNTPGARYPAADHYRQVLTDGRGDQAQPDWARLDTFTAATIAARGTVRWSE
jgi:hypothetical protein